MASLNRVFLMGNLTKDVELRYTPSGMAVTDLRLAVNERVKDGDSWTEKAIFLDVTVWGRQAETCDQYLAKGSPVMVEGRLQMDEWTDKQDGGKRSRLKVVANRVQFMGSPRDEDGRSSRPEPRRDAPPAMDDAPPPDSGGGEDGLQDDDNLPF
jgi:single-strand DNA-binding protein